MLFDQIVSSTNYDVVGTVDLTKSIKPQLQALYKDVFNDNERIFVQYNQDEFRTVDDIGETLRAFQMLVDEVDISNYFIIVVSGYEHIQRDLSALKSQDPMTHIVSTNTFNKVINKNATSQFGYTSAELDHMDINELTERERYLLTESKTFCMYPWVHILPYATGDVQPCCGTTYIPGKFGNSKTQSLQDIWSTDAMKNLRQDMLSERMNESCAVCHSQEQLGFFSLRNTANKQFGHHIKQGTDIDPPFKMIFWDVRFSNLCNLSCRSCSHRSSSSWYTDQIAMEGESHDNLPAMFYAGKHKLDMFDQLMPHIDHVEHIYFAGGEPLVMEEHYMILDELIKRKMFDIKLVYNTNFTKNKLKDKTVFDYWKQFTSVCIGASLDAMGDRAELIRNGTKWADIESNRQMLQEHCPHVDFYISPTTSIQNVMHIPDFHREWVERGWLRPEDLRIQILENPQWLRIDIATDNYKQMIQQKLEQHLAWLRPLDKLNRATVGIESSIRFLQNNNQQHLPMFWNKMQQLDELRNQNFMEVIPELKLLHQEYIENELQRNY